MSLSEISIRRPVFAWMLMLGLIIFGALSFRLLGVSQMPDVDFPVVSVNVSMPGAAPEVMETQVVDVIEDAVMEIQGIRSVNSTSQQSSARISVEFELSQDIDAAVQDIQTHIAQVQSLLPAQMLPATIRKSNPEDQPILWLALTTDGTVNRADMMRYARNVLQDEFTTVAGVGDVALGGYVDANLRIWLSAPRLRALELTAGDIIKAIQTEQVDTPVGRIENDQVEANVRMMGQAATPEDFGRILVAGRGGGSNFVPVRLDRVARIEEGLADVRRLSRLNGKVAVGLGIMKQHGSNAVAVAREVRARLASLQSQLPKGMELSVRNDQTRFIQDSVDELNFTLLFSALLTAFVCFLFLGSWSSTVNVLMSIPTSIVGSFIVLHFFGFTLNTFTLLGLSLAIGIVVDDSIMMLENIVRHGEMGKSRVHAALDGSREITFAAVAATIAVVAIFLPVIFMDGIVGRFLFHYGITVTAAVLLSLLEALTLTPMRCSRFLAIGAAKNHLERGMDWLMGGMAKRYARLLQHILRWQWLVILVSLGIFAASLSLIRLIPSEMMPAQDQGSFILRLTAPVGSSLELTDGASKRAEDYLGTLTEVTDRFASVGGFGGDAVNQSMIFVNLKPRKERQLNQRAVMDKVRKELSSQLHGIKVFVQDLSMRGFSSGRGYPVEVSIEGPNWDQLGKLVEVLQDKMEATGLMTDVNTDYQISMPEYHLTPNRAAAAEQGVSIAQVSTEINALIGGAVLSSSTQYPKDNHRYNINVRLEAQERAKLANFDQLAVRNNRGQLVPLKSVISVEEQPSLQQVTRHNRMRSIPVYANVEAGHAQKEALAAVEAICKDILPSGYSLRMTGSAQAFQETFRSLLVALILGIFVSYMVLASQFNSFIHPVTVLMALPFSISGAFLGLFVTHQSINMFSLIGLILLMGIVKKNSILLIDFTNQHRRTEGLSAKEALLVACPVRLRPILMTSLATIAGSLPAALALGPGAETRVPMAVAIIGGVLMSTGLTLLVVPCVYQALARFERRAVD